LSSYRRCSDCLNHSLEVTVVAVTGTDDWIAWVLQHNEVVISIQFGNEVQPILPFPLSHQDYDGPAFHGFLNQVEAVLL
jgi:hypothetical protein